VTLQSPNQASLYSNLVRAAGFPLGQIEAADHDIVHAPLEVATMLVVGISRQARMISVGVVPRDKIATPL